MDAFSPNLTAEPPPPVPLVLAATPLYLREGTIFSILSFIAALLNFASQAIFCRLLGEGEYGNLNATLGLIGLFGIPLAAINQSLTHHLAQYQAQGSATDIARFRASALSALETVAYAMGLVCIVLLGFSQTFFSIPRMTLASIALVTVFFSLGLTVSGAFCCGLNRFRLWGSLLIAAGVIRLTCGVLLCRAYPWAEAAVAAVALGWILPVLPLFQTAEEPIDRFAAFRTFLEPKFVRYFLASLSITGALYLFSNGDQIIAQRWFSQNRADGLAIIPAHEYDAYQAAGVLGRALLWGAAPILAVLFTQRSGETKTTKKTIQLLALYGAALFFGMFLLKILAGPLVLMLHGQPFPGALIYLPWFANAMVPIGLVQLAGIFCLASRRFPECYLLGGCSLLYAALLYLFARQPEYMLTFMFGGSACTLLLVFFFGIVRWSRARP